MCATRRKTRRCFLLLHATSSFKGITGMSRQKAIVRCYTSHRTFLESFFFVLFRCRTTKRRALLLDLVLRNEGRTILPLASEALQFSFLSSKEPKRRPCCRTRETLHRYTQVFERRSEIPLYFLVHNAFCNDCMPDRRRSTCGSSIDDASPPLAVIIVIAVRGTTAS